VWFFMVLISHTEVIDISFIDWELYSMTDWRRSKVLKKTVLHENASVYKK